MTAPIQSVDRIFSDGQEAKPSRLGPWPKACSGCAMRNGDPQRIGVDVQEDVRNLVACGSLTFFCLHRTTAAGRHRECACAAAIAKAKNVSASTDIGI
jgi:hypothetical protein